MFRHQVEIGLRKIVKIFNIELTGPAILVIFILDSISAIVGVNNPLSFGIDRFPKIRCIVISEGHPAAIGVVHVGHSFEAVERHGLDIALAILDADELVVEVVGAFGQPVSHGTGIARVGQFNDFGYGNEPVQTVGKLHVGGTEVRRANAEVFFIENPFLERKILSSGLSPRPTPRFGWNDRANLASCGVIEKIA